MCSSSFVHVVDPAAAAAASKFNEMRMHVMPLNGKCAIFLIDSGSVETKRLVTRDNCDAQRNHFRGIDFE